MSGTLTEPRNFNLMMKTAIGPMEDSASQAYLRPETAQGIFVNFKNIYQSARKRPPFGIAQIGKSFRNEITPGNFTFRVREFEQAELEYFVPDDGNDVNVYETWVAARKKWYSDYGVRADRLRFYELSPTERPHYAKAGTDVEYLFPWGWGELESIAHRGTYDLDAHMKLSGKDLRYFDEASKAHFTPILIECSAGMDRTTLTMLIDAYENETTVDPESGIRRSRRSRSASFRSRATSPNWSSARSASSADSVRSSARSTMKATSASSTAARTRSGRRRASWSTTIR
jgi:glycyl-tRNA synthetase